MASVDKHWFGGLSHMSGVRARHPAALNSDPHAIYILDGVYLSGRENAALICRTMAAQLSWMFAGRHLGNWLAFLKKLPTPYAAVIDGQKGLLAAIQRLWPQTKIQRCLVHIERLARIKLARHPKTTTGRELLKLVQGLFTVRTRRQRRRWLTGDRPRFQATSNRQLLPRYSSQACALSGTAEMRSPTAFMTAIKVFSVGLPLGERARYRLSRWIPASSATLAMP